MNSAGWLEEIQDFIDSATNISYTTGTDLFIGRVFTFDDILTSPSLTLYEESGGLEFGRIEKQTRNIRFVFRDSSVDAVLNRAHAFYEWTIGNRVIEGTTYKTQMLRVFRTPALVDVVNSIFIADCVIGYMVTGN